MTDIAVLPPGFTPSPLIFVLIRQRRLKEDGRIVSRLNYETRADYQVESMDQIADPDHVRLGKVIRSLARQLSKVQRLVFVLRDIQDLPVEEVCHITGFDAGKVKSNLYYARKFMREKLEKGGYL